jgi:hypothetical protein
MLRACVLGYYGREFVPLYERGCTTTSITLFKKITVGVFLRSSAYLTQIFELLLINNFITKPPKLNIYSLN